MIKSEVPLVAQSRETVAFQEHSQIKYLLLHDDSKMKQPMTLKG